MVDVISTTDASIGTCTGNKDDAADRDDDRSFRIINLILEFPVLVLAEEDSPDSRESIGLEELEALFEGIVDVNLARSVVNPDTTSTV